MSADGTQEIVMTYRARNGFGGVNTGVALGKYRDANCSPWIVSIQ